MIKNILGGLKRNRDSFILYAHLSGDVKVLSEVKDDVFSGGLLGKGVAIEPKEGVLYSPCGGVIDSVFDTKHAINILSDFGCEILLHIGIDTVNLKGKGFEVKVKAKDRVNKGDVLCVFDMDTIKSAGLDTITPMVICNSDEYGSVEILPKNSVKAGDAIMRVTK